ncbi:MAG: hypothetical protein AAF654_05375 [Myxococcota bacterium]
MNTLIVILTLAGGRPCELESIQSVRFKDGSVVDGTVARTDDTLTVVTRGGLRLEAPSARVESVTEVNACVGADGTVRHDDPNRTRYLYAPSSLMLRKGETQFAQRQLLFSTLAVGVTDHVSLQFGSVIPALFVEEGVNFIGGIKVGTSLSDRLHIATGVQSLFIPGANIAAGFGFGSLTFGDSFANATVSAGVPFAIGGDGSEVSDVIVVLSGQTRVGESFALVSENWLLPSVDDDFFSIHGLAGRIVGRRWSTDIGFVVGRGLGAPIPWLGVTYNFSKG